MPTRLIAAVSAVLLTACGDLQGPLGTGGSAGGPPLGAGGGTGIGVDQEALSGTRLKNRYVVGEDGSRTPNGFFDLHRGDACTFIPSDDGKLRCLPLEGALPNGGVLYSDSACTQRVAMSTLCTASRYMFETTAACPSTFTMRPLTVYVPGDLFQKTGPSEPCTAASPQASATYYKVGAKIPAGEFVAGSVMVDP